MKNILLLLNILIVLSLPLSDNILAQGKVEDKKISEMKATDKKVVETKTSSVSKETENSKNDCTA